MDDGYWMVDFIVYMYEIFKDWEKSCLDSLHLEHKRHPQEASPGRQRMATLVSPADAASWGVKSNYAGSLLCSLKDAWFQKGACTWPEEERAPSPAPSLWPLLGNAPSHLCAGQPWSQKPPGPLSTLGGGGREGWRVRRHTITV